MFGPPNTSWESLLGFQTPPQKVFGGFWKTRVLIFTCHYQYHSYNSYRYNSIRNKQHSSDVFLLVHLSQSFEGLHAISEKQRNLLKARYSQSPATLRVVGKHHFEHLDINQEDQGVNFFNPQHPEGCHACISTSSFKGSWGKPQKTRWSNY